MGKIKAATPANKSAKRKNKRIKAVRGHPNDPETKRKIQYRVKKACLANKAIFIGKTCAKGGLNQRFLAKYKKMGFKRGDIQPIYKTTSEKYAAEVEKMAIGAVTSDSCM